MRKPWIVIALTAVALVAASIVVSTGGEAGGSSSQEDSEARATLRNAAGAKIGKVKLEQKGDSVRIRVDIDGVVTAGFHGFHVHAVGKCEAPFTTAGPHYNPDATTHRDHAGDLPVIYVDADGEADARFATDRFALGELFDADGSAFILHADPDNYANIPTRYVAAPHAPGPDGATQATGDAGPRFACGVVQED
jgi:Cu-Zn family superoxide dismutase